MASLVADYGSASESESDSEEPITKTSPEDDGGGINFLTSDITGESDDEEEERGIAKKEDLSDRDQPRLPNPMALDRLPVPDLSAPDAQSLQGSVFANPYLKAEEVKHSILEQHVKMTANEQEKNAKSNKKICWNFRKGRCRFGQKCKYSHDNDIVVRTEELSSSEAVTSTGGGNTEYGQHSWGQDVPDADDDSYMNNAKKKKRAGVNDTLLPPKKAMRSLTNQRQQERPWTVPK